jgi:hypothetical protein
MSIGVKEANRPIPTDLKKRTARRVMAEQGGTAEQGRRRRHCSSTSSPDSGLESPDVVEIR